MSDKPGTSGPRKWFSEIRSFVYTLAVVAFGIAFVSALFNGGTGGAEDFIRSVIQWIFALLQNVIDAVRGFAAGAQQ